MKQNLKGSGNVPNRLFSQLVAEKKKSVMALCLIAVMAFMWTRTLGKKTPVTAEAALRPGDVNADVLGSNSELKISFIELPNVKGRNDVLTRDFFAVEGKKLGSTQEMSVISRNGSEKVVRRVAEKLKLEAIVLSENPQAFINDKLLTIGDKLLVRDGANTYECEIVGIEEKKVFIRCGEAEIQLKLTQASVIDY